MIHTSAVIEGRRVTIGYREGKRETDLFTDMDFRSEEHTSELQSQR